MTGGVTLSQDEVAVLREMVSRYLDTGDEKDGRRLACMVEYQLAGLRRETEKDFLS